MFWRCHKDGYAHISTTEESSSRAGGLSISNAFAFLRVGMQHIHQAGQAQQWSEIPPTHAGGRQCLAQDRTTYLRPDTVHSCSGLPRPGGQEGARISPNDGFCRRTRYARLRLEGPRAAFLLCRHEPPGTSATGRRRESRIRLATLGADDGVRAPSYMTTETGCFEPDRQHPQSAILQDA